MYKIFYYDFLNNYFYINENNGTFPTQEEKNQITQHLFNCAHNMFLLNGSTSGEVLDGINPKYKIKWVNYNQ
jgi:hypothetical protein